VEWCLDLQLSNVQGTWLARHQPPTPGVYRVVGQRSSFNLSTSTAAVEFRFLVDNSSRCRSALDAHSSALSARSSAQASADSILSSFSRTGSLTEPVRFVAGRGVEVGLGRWAFVSGCDLWMTWPAVDSQPRVLRTQ